jgi:hypothetical protein
MTTEKKNPVVVVKMSIVDFVSFRSLAMWHTLKSHHNSIGTIGRAAEGHGEIAAMEDFAKQVLSQYLFQKKLFEAIQLCLQMNASTLNFICNEATWFFMQQIMTNQDMIEKLRASADDEGRLDRFDQSIKRIQDAVSNVTRMDLSEIEAQISVPVAAPPGDYLN